MTWILNQPRCVYFSEKKNIYALAYKSTPTYYKIIKKQKDLLKFKLKFKYYYYKISK